jgi:uncharacterized protein
VSKDRLFESRELGGRKSAVVTELGVSSRSMVSRRVAHPCSLGEIRCANSLRFDAPSDAEELFVTKAQYEVFEALNPFFEVVMEGLRGLADGDYYFDTFAEDAVFESRYHFPGWPVTIRGRANLMASLSGYGKTIKLHSGDALVVHRSQDSRIVILEYEVHGKILSTGAHYDNRLISVVTIKNRKITHWRDHMDSLAAWTALNGAP